MSLPSYPEYKDSGVAWLGEVPGHWDVKRIKNTTYLKGRVGWKGLTSDEYLEEGYAYLVTGTDFSDRFIHWNECHCVERERYEDDPFIQLRNGDLLITKDGTIGKLALVKGLDRPACLNSGIFLLRPEVLYITEYMYWVLSSRPFSVFCDLSSFGSTIQHLYQNVFERFSFPVPSFEEQQTITAFLDRETGKIDALIAEQQRLVELLAEKRQAVISHAVTKGLNPNAPMKDSGIEWLGEVPEHWEVFSIRRSLIEHRQGYYSTNPYADAGVRLLRITDLREGGNIDYSESPFVDERQEIEPFLLQKSDFVFARTGGAGTFGVVNEITEPVAYASYLIRFRFDSTLCTNFLRYFFLSVSFQSALEQNIHGGVNQNVHAEDIKSQFVAVPPQEEQSAIATFLDTETAKFDTLSLEANRAIALLQERRNALISAAVTGKIDVRLAA